MLPSTMELTVMVCRMPLLFLVVLCALAAEFTDVPPLEAGEQVDMAVDSDGRVFLAAGRRLLRLDGDLTVSEDVTVNSSILKTALSYDGGKLVVCCVDESCAVYDAGDFSAGQLLSVEQASTSPDNLALFTSPDDTFYVGSVGALQGTVDLVYLTQYGLGDNKFTRSSGLDFNIQVGGFDRLFGGGFTNGLYSYYIVSDDNADGAIALRALRVCHLDTCVPGTNCDFATLYEVELPCGFLSSTPVAICGVSLVESFLGSPDPTVVYSICGPRNRVCSVPLATIDAVINDTYTECSTPDSTDQNEVVWEVTGGAPPTCSSIFMAATGPTSICEHGPEPLLLSNFEDISTSVLYDPSVDEITATLAIAVEDVTLLYVAYTDGGQHSIDAVHVQGASTAVSFYTTEVLAPVVELKWLDGLEYVYAVSEDSVLQVPLEQCSQLTDCENCTASSNPLCGWCTVEQKCSRQSQCQNSTETMRWVQDGSQCINSTLVPTQFVLGIGQNVNVSVTPSLPPRLSGETYSCLFKESGGSLEFTTSATTEDGSVYTCAVNGTVPAFDGAMLVIDFSFVSSLIGIPFGIEEGAITFFNCPAAISCTECVETDNACGWCIFNKLCRGTPDDCTNETYWLRMGEASGSEEVCPLLVPHTMPSGDYVQPVEIDRDLELVTWNLPEPPSGDFIYECSLMTSSPLSLPAVYNNETSVTCLVNANQIMLPSGSGEESVQILLVWVRSSDSFRHPIDTLGGIQINTLLYNCVELGDRCSICLASNTETGYDCAWCSDNTCGVESECTGTPTTMSSGCPAPTITSITPESGPVTGGTTILISGTELGVVYSDVEGSVYLGAGSSIPCMTSEDLYIPGVQIGCVTTDFGGGVTPFTLDVRVELVSGMASGPAFTVVTPTVTGVDPTIGPVAGGVAVTVTGTDLATGNMDNTRVTLSGTDCIIESTEDIEDTTIVCTSPPSSEDSAVCDLRPVTAEDPCPERNFISSVFVQVIVDGSDFPPTSDVLYQYQCDPFIRSVFPTDTIHAGGIALTFTGCDTDIVQNPELVVTSETRRSTSARSTCTTTSNTTVDCVMPQLDSDSVRSTLSYALFFGNLDATLNSMFNLDVMVVENPSFAPDALITTEVLLEGANQPIDIEVMHFDSVELEEYMVTVSGAVCGQPRRLDSETLQCTAPTGIPAGTSAPVVVFVGTNLNFSVGSVEYVGTGGGGGGSDSPVVGIAVGGAIVVVGLICVVIIIIVLRCRSNVHHKWQLTNEIEMSNTQVNEEPQPLTNQLAKKLPERLLIPSNHLRILHNRAIGEGEYGVVYKAHLIKWQGHENTRAVAVKTLRGLFTGKDVQNMLEEILKMAAFGEHSNVMPLLGVCTDIGPGVAIIMPYMAQGNLLDYVKRERSKLVVPETLSADAVNAVKKLLLRFCYQISCGMEYLANHKFVHRDLAARNCMLDSDGNLKVSDFGLGEDVYTTGYFRQNTAVPVKLPFKWMAPESLEEGIFTEKTDVWAFGVTCWETFTGGKLPYPGVDPSSIASLLNVGMRLEKPINAACSINIFAMMLRCWSANPSSRPTFSELTSSLNTTLESVAEYMEVQMNLVPVNPDDEEGYVITSLDETSSNGLVPKEGEQDGVGPEVVYENAGAVESYTEHADDIAVHPNPVYGERSEHGGDGEIPVHPNPVYGECGSDGQIPVHPNPVYGECSDAGKEDNPAM